MHVYYLYPIQAYLNWTIDSLISCKTVYQLKVETMSESCFWCHRNSRREEERSQNELHRNTASRPLLILCRCQPMGAAPRGRAQPPIGTRGALRWSQTQVWGVIRSLKETRHDHATVQEPKLKTSGGGSHHRWRTREDGGVRTGVTSNFRGETNFVLNFFFFLDREAGWSDRASTTQTFTSVGIVAQGLCVKMDSTISTFRGALLVVFTASCLLHGSSGEIPPRPTGGDTLLPPVKPEVPQAYPDADKANLPVFTMDYPRIQIPFEITLWVLLASFAKIGK